MAKAAAELEQKEMSWRKERQIDDNFEGWIFAGYSEDYEGGWFDETTKEKLIWENWNEGIKTIFFYIFTFLLILFKLQGSQIIMEE